MGSSATLSRCFGRAIERGVGSRSMDVGGKIKTV